MNTSYYEILGLPETADLADIKAAYRRRALECHPDRGGSHEQMLLLNEAFEILANPETRQRYDTLSRQPGPALEVNRAREDAAKARAQAEQYPREWREFEGWMDGLFRDFSDAKYSSKEIGQFKVPIIQNSASGILFLLVGLGAGIWLDTQIFDFENLKGSVGILLALPPIAGAWLASFLHASIASSMKPSNPAQEASGTTGAVPPESVIIACNRCGQKLRIRPEQRQAMLRCGACQNEFRVGT